MIGEVDRSAAGASLIVEIGTRLNVVTDICDRNNQPPAFPLRLTVNCIVKILCGRTVDGYERELTKILPSTLSTGGDVGR